MSETGSVTTPENIKFSKGINRSGGINKNFLTPCRRVGLCRKPKTPLSTGTASPLTPINNDSSSKFDKQQNSTFVSTPVSSKENDEISAIQKNNTATKSKVNIQSRFESKEIVSPKLHGSRKSNSALRQNKICISHKFEENTSDLDLKSNLSKSFSSITSSLVSNKTAVSDVNSVPNSLGSNSQEVNTPALQEKKKRQQLSTTKLGSSQNEFSDSDHCCLTPKISALWQPSQEIQGCIVNIEEIPLVDTIPKEIDSKDRFSIRSKSDKKRKKLVYSSDEDDFVASQNSCKSTTSVKKQIQDDDVCKRYNEDNLQTAVKVLQQSIKVKENQLTELKQAAIYKKLHNVDELQQTTMVWKKGCQDALYDLLKNLREHGNMNMSILLKNLNISNDMLSYSIEKDMFV